MTKPALATVTIDGKEYPAEPAYIVPQLRPLAIHRSKLHKDPRNARLHPADNTAITRGSLVRFGQFLPLIVQRDGMVIRVGNNRFDITAELGWEFLACVITDEPEAAAHALAVVENRSGETATWDEAALRALTWDIATLDRSLLTVTGFTTDYINDLFKLPDLPAQDHGEPAAKTLRTVYRCPNCKHEWNGKHRP